MRVVKQWHREVVDASSMKIFKARLDWALRDLT